MTVAPEIVTVGRVSVDLYSPDRGLGWQEARSFVKALGGSPTNVAVAAARLGRRAAVATKVGDDPFGDIVRHELRRYGVDDRFVGTVAGAATPLAFAVLDPPEEPQLHFVRGDRPPDLDLESADLDGAQEAEVLWISAGALSAEPSAASVEALLRRRGRGRETVLDLDYRPSFWPSREAASRRIGAALAHVTVAVGNREECAVAVGSDDPEEAAARLRAAGVRLAIVKLGGDGVLAVDDAGTHRIAPTPVEIVCGLGAGDAFGGALCHALLDGRDTVAAITFANAAGAIVASQLLCSEAMPTEREIVALLASGRSAQAVVE